MTLYRYFCRMRPPGPGAVPKRNLHTAVAEHIAIAGQERHMWGCVDYTQPLTEEEIEEYELVQGGMVDTEE